MTRWALATGLSAAALLSSGCQVRGLIGSNESATTDDAEADSGDAADAVGQSSDGVDTAASSAASGGEDSAASASGGGTTGTADDESTSDMPTDPAPLFDVAPDDDPNLCAPPTFPSCDGNDGATWYQALGLGCSDIDESVFAHTGELGSMIVHEGRMGGEASPFAPREGERFVILSTGRAAEVPMTPEELSALHPLECDDPQQCPSSDLGGALRDFLPEPLTPRRVHDELDCIDAPLLVGEGDCSNSLAEHWAQGEGAYDYVELRMRTQVPPHTDALSFDFAFFSSEYPLYTEHGVLTPYNDMYIAWLESESWTGNVSFDDEMNPITVQSVFLDYRSPSADCPDCDAPELEGFSMQHHAGTKWLTTKAPVKAEETIELVFALFDLTDSVFDSVVVLDNFDWTCSGGRPITTEG
ncbi:MAG: choice-of-anchor L domain-containing protein [Myxococcota bacterium]